MLGVTDGSADLGQGLDLAPKYQTPLLAHIAWKGNLDFLVKELRRLGVAIAGIQEIKWFGKDMWTVDGYILLHSAHTTG